MEQKPVNPNTEESDGPPRGVRPPRRSFWLLVLLVLLTLLIFSSQFATSVSIIKDYAFFEQQVRQGNVLEVEIGPKELTGKFKIPPTPPDEYDDNGRPVPKVEKLRKNFLVAIPTTEEGRNSLQRLLEEQKVSFSFRRSDQDATQSFWMIALLLLPIVMFVLIWYQFRKTRDQLVGGGFLSGFSRSPAKRYEGAKQVISFKDVAGLEGVKADLLEIVDFLKSPEKFQRLGGRIPKGVLLMGPPGTGKTLLARAIAGEAGVPFYSVNGSEFIQMFVGVGASRVRDLFRTAKELAPSIIFVDEIDAVGRQRGAGLGGGHDEREQTLNQILGEMDGFSPSETVIVIAATNRPDVLDPALLRPGRFDRHLTVSRPSLKGRIEMFKVHVRDVPLAEDVDLEVLAAATVGLTGADIHNIVNEAALWAARNNKTKVEATDFEYARDKVLIGAKREEVLTDDEKEKTAYHEAGHTLAAWLLPHARRVHKVTIIPRGRSLGNTQMLPAEDRVNMSAVELRDHLVVMLAGRAAEEVIYNETTVGAENDLEQATGIARHMVTHWGMSERLGPVSYKQSDDDPFLGREIHRGRPFSERTMEVIDEEVTKILHDADQRAVELLGNHREKLEIITRELVRQEELDEQDITKLIGPSAHPRRPTEALASA
ncbi:MAG: ATP-dependent zinc metalloprotease FtsH [Planctomycetes bacterium]|nr:ATP-dependent zinc metalloprotease FtsH [Planctomycetota bacterium]